MREDLARRLIEEQARFLAFLRRRLADPTAAEDVLQAAYVKVLERGGTLRDRESVVAWFYRILRRALVDHARREGARHRAVRRAGDRALERGGSDATLHDAACTCVAGLLGTLRRDQADLLRRVDLEGEPVAAVADTLGLTANHASVRILRARTALRDRVAAMCGACARHGCLVCECRTSGPPRRSRP